MPGEPKCLSAQVPECPSARMSTNAKTYWSILKTLLNSKKNPCIPPLFHQGKCYRF